MRRYGIYLAWIVSIVATACSLYFSEIANWTPCVLCWYQRIFMYPLVIILGMAVYQEDRDIYIYVLPLTLIGGSISLLHYLGQKISAFQMVMRCHVKASCFVDSLNFLGIVTIPLLSFFAFSLIALCVWIGCPTKDKI